MFLCRKQQEFSEQKDPGDKLERGRKESLSDKLGMEVPLQVTSKSKPLGLSKVIQRRSWTRMLVPTSGLLPQEMSLTHPPGEEGIRHHEKLTIEDGHEGSGEGCQGA